MIEERRVAPFAIDLTRFGGRSVTSFYSNLVTRPTGRAVRMGVESQIAELGREQYVCLSILDFSQVRILDYSCADEIVAKLLLRYLRQDRPVEAYFLARGLEDHHRDAVEAVLERHRLLLASETGSGGYQLLGPCDTLQRRCWHALDQRGRGRDLELADELGLVPEAVAPALGALAVRRVAAPLRDGSFCAVTALLGVAA